MTTAALITNHQWLPNHHLRNAYDMYATTFAAINTQAAQRHLMHKEEFDDVMRDDRVAKHIATTFHDGIVGLSVITSDLAAWPLISPAYFRHRWPDLYDRQAIYYVGFVCTTRTAPITTFRDLIADMGQQVFDAKGMAVMDFCTANVNRNLIRATTKILTRLNPHTSGGPIDTQVFAAWRFDGGTTDE